MRGVALPVRALLWLRLVFKTQSASCGERSLHSIVLDLGQRPGVTQRATPGCDHRQHHPRQPEQQHRCIEGAAQGGAAHGGSYLIGGPASQS